MLISGIQGLPLEVTIIACYNLDDKEWISRQDPYVCLEYGGTKYRTKTCTDGGRNPAFQEKFVFTLVEGLRELNVVVWNSNTITSDELIGSGKVQLYKTLTQGFDDSTWPLHSKSGRHAGEIRLILHFPNVNTLRKNEEPKSTAKLAPSGREYATPFNAISQMLPYGAPPLPQAPPSGYPPATAYPAPPPSTSYPPNSSSYPPTSYPPTSYPPPSYPPTSYPPSSYPPTSYSPSLYPPAVPNFYPPQQTSHHEVYPPSPYPPPQASPYYPSGPPSGCYPPPPPY